MQNSQQAIADSSTKSTREVTNISLDKTANSGRPGHDELVPSRYAVKIGEIDVMVVSDGVLSLPGAMLGHNIDPAIRGAWLEDNFVPRRSDHTHRRWARSGSGVELAEGWEVGSAIGGRRRY